MPGLCDCSAVPNNSNSNSNSGLLYWSWKQSIAHLEENKTSQYSFQMLYCPLENINAGILAQFT